VAPLADDLRQDRDASNGEQGGCRHPLHRASNDLNVSWGFSLLNP
jgi:hypothetical protein